MYVVPGANHLWELKQVLYDHPYPNEERETPYDGFTYQTIVPVDGVITLERQSDIHCLVPNDPLLLENPEGRSGAPRRLGTSHDSDFFPDSHLSKALIDGGPSFDQANSKKDAYLQ